MIIVSQYEKFAGTFIKMFRFDILSLRKRKRVDLVKNKFVV